jgi:hypothetical protein
MYHMIEFGAAFVAEVQVCPIVRLSRLKFEKGTRWSAEIRPYVIEGVNGPVEVADLCFDDGFTARNVPFSKFCFVDRPEGGQA